MDRLWHTLIIAGCDSNDEVNITNFKRWKQMKLSPKMMSAKLLVIVILNVKHYPSTYCLMQEVVVSFVATFKIWVNFTSKL